MTTHRRHSRIVDAHLALQKNFNGKLFPQQLDLGGITINGHQKLAEYTIAQAVREEYISPKVYSEPRGDSTFPDLFVKPIHGPGSAVEAKTFIRSRNNGNNNSFGVAARSKFYDSPLATACYLRAHYIIWDFYEGENNKLWTNQVHHKKFSELVHFKDGLINWQKVGNGRLRPQTGWEDYSENSGRQEELFSSIENEMGVEFLTEVKHALAKHPSIDF